MEAEDFLNGKSQAVKADLARQMEEAAEALDFERAATYRDRIQAMSFVTQTQGINPQSVDEADVFGMAQEGGQTCIQVFFFRSFQNWGNRAYYPKADRSLEAPEILASFLAQFYDDKPVPGLVLLSHDIEERELLEEALSTLAGRKVEIAVPQRGEKASAGRACRHQCARGAGAEDGGILVAGEAAGRRAAGVRPAGDAGPHRGLRQLAHPGHQSGGRHDRRRAGRIHEVAIPQVQHQDARISDRMISP